MSVRSGWPASHLPDPSDTSQLCVCLRDSAHASSSLRRRRPVSRAVAAQCGDWLPYTTPLATLGDRRTILHSDIRSRKQQNNAFTKGRPAVKISPNGPRGHGDYVGNIEMGFKDQDSC